MLLICGALLIGVWLPRTLGASQPGLKTTEPFDHMAVLDEDGMYTLFWNFNSTHITFEAHVQTKGWVGLGISGNGNMFPGDVALGWVTDHGQVHFADRHTTDHRMPLVDTSQDWFLLHAEETSAGTVLKMVRKLQTCDAADDIDIHNGTNRVIYAFGSDDPQNDRSILYHGATRGTKSLFLLNPDKGDGKIPETKIKHFDFLNLNFMVPNDTTTYLCRAFIMPPIGKHHMIKFEPVITPGNEKHVHHILLSRCKVDNPSQYDGKSDSCYDYQKQVIPNCGDYIISWAIGGESFYLPANVGFSVGAPEDPVLYRMETHYDNPNGRDDILDNSGIRITLTSELRAQEAGMLVMGLLTSFKQVVPPGQSNFVSRAFCRDDCIRLGLTQANIAEFKIFGVLQHSHLAGVRITTRHFRGGNELPPIIDDPNYDFNFQELRRLPKEIAVHPGDNFRIDCHYNTVGKSQPVLGGLATTNEMCLSFAYYYPKTPLANCLWNPTYGMSGADGDAKVYYYMRATWQMIQNADWSNKTVVDWFYQQQSTGPGYEYCAGDSLKIPANFDYTFTGYLPPHDYVEPDTCP
ncbi:DBH-like monooxygenase protein 1 isoform X1 [Dreissena polymorpha]|uniref:DBH-like monooxygenase protein 1 isoform X1 n=1 Tax=Dreissena polymorpha TaxID=45954 RepID=UPI002264661A|nr:DBH-like monooxygenase protein 1 isoform X1 [Dreissena polymorpha]